MDTPPAGRVIVLTGPPGAGKSTVARVLAAERLSPGVHLHSDDFFACIRQGAVAPYLPAAQRQNEVVIGVLAQAAFGYAAGGYQVVCDGVVGPWFLGPFRAAGAAAGLPLHYVVLRPDEPTTLHRAADRGGDALTDPEPVRSLHRQFSDLGELEAHALDSSRLTPAATATAVLAGITANHYLLPPPG